MRLSNKKLANPFVYQGYESPKYFCDREAETKTLLSHLKNGRNITLISPRRIGKTGLIKNTFYHLKEEENDAICLYLDIFATKNLNDFVEQLGVMVINNIVRKNASFFEKTIAKDSIVAQPTSGKFIKEHKQSGASSVKAALKILEDKELVYRTNDGYLIYDRFMDLWLKRI